MQSTLQLIVATVRPPEEIQEITSRWLGLCTYEHPVFYAYNQGTGPVSAYQEAFLKTPEAEIYGYIHDDVAIYERGWDERVLALFESPRVGVVGFGGAWGHGTDEIYKTPYRLQQLQRLGYSSNADDAENHGTRFGGDREVAVLDGYALFTRRSLLEEAGGWPVKDLVFHCYDYWLCCIAHRLGYQVWMTGVHCQHFGGQTSTANNYNQWLSSQGKTDFDIHRESHVYIYNEFSDVLPYRVR